jgi:uncharacterized protein (TIGR03437 family)
MCPSVPDIRCIVRLAFAASLVTGLLARPPESASPTIAPRIAIGEVVVDADRSASVDVTLTAADQAIVGVQFDIRYQAEVLGLSISLASAASNAGKQVWTADLEPGMVRALIVGLNQTPIRDGPLVTLLVQVKQAIPAGRYPLTIDGVVAVDSDRSVVIPEAASGAVIVSGAGVTAPAVRGVANAASYAAGALAPGEIVVIAGTSLGEGGTRTLELDAAGSVATSLGATRVLFDGVPAPLVYTTPDQASAIVPYAVDGQSQTSLQVEWRGVRSAPVILPVNQTSPGIFTLDQSGTGEGAIVNVDGSINGPDHPAAPGSVVLIYGTGEGQTSPPGVDGSMVTSTELRRPLLPVAVSIGGRSAEVVYAGSAAGQVSGLFQINARVPAGLAPSDTWPVTVKVGSNSSQAGVTMTVR